MQKDKVDYYLMANNKYLPSDKINIVSDKLLALDESRSTAITAVQFKDPNIILLVSIFLGGFGIDRFLIGDIGLGILKLLTLGFCGIWVVIDWFLIQKRTRKKNFDMLMQML